MTKRLCSILLVMALCLGLIPNVALATEVNENLSLNASVLGVSMTPPNQKEHARYALDGSREYTKWCAINPVGWMVFQTKEAIRPAGMMTYHAGFGFSETVKHNTRKFQLEILNSAVLSEADFLNLSQQDQQAAMESNNNWLSVTGTIENESNIRYSSINMPEARSIFRFRVMDAGKDHVIRLYELELLAHAPVPQAIALQPITMFEDETVTLNPLFTPDYCEESVSYSVTDPDIAECVDGKLLGKKPGTTTITVTVDNHPQIHATADVTVNEYQCRTFYNHVPIRWEKFEGESLPEGWIAQDRDGDGSTWQINTDSKVHHGRQSLFSKHSGNGDGGNDNWLVTPEFLVGYEYIFDLMASGSDRNASREMVRFYVLEEGKDPVKLDDGASFIDGSGWYQLYADLAKYEGRRIRVAFAHQSGSKDAMLFTDCAGLWRKDQYKHTSEVVFQVQNGTWDGQDRTNKVQKVQLINGYGTLPEAVVPTNMQPDPGYETGSWDMVPNVDENGVIGNIVYTYTFEEKKLPKESATVTFQTVNGSFADADTDIQKVSVKLVNGKGTLSADDIPAFSDMIPSSGYGFGAWNVIPNTQKDAITQDVTYQYIFTPARVRLNYVPIWWEEFEGETLPEGWTSEIHDGSGNGWELCSNGAVHHGQQSIKSQAHAAVPGVIPENWLIMPEFLVGHHYVFDVLVTGSSSTTETMQIYILEEGKEPVVAGMKATLVTNAYWFELNADLSEYEGRRIRIAIAHLADTANEAVFADCAALWRKNLKQHTAKVVFKVQNGTWDGQNKNDRIQEVQLTNGYGTLPDTAVPTNMKPAPNYEKGSWNVTPNVDKNGVIGDIVYTYTFEEKPFSKDHATVTFQTVNGSFAGTDTDIRKVSVELVNGKGTLSADDIPAPSEMIPASNYGSGAWNVIPSTEKNAITRDVTYQYIFSPVYQVEFQLIGGTWANGEDKTISYTFPQRNETVYLTKGQVPTGMIPDKDHTPQGGAWYIAENSLKRIDNILEYPITKSTRFCYIFEGKHVIMPERTLLLSGCEIYVSVQSGMTELTSDDATVEIKCQFERPDYTMYRIQIPDVPKTYTLKALDPSDGNKEISVQIQVLAKSPFSDVGKDQWFSNQVIWAVENEITDGFPDGTFQPNAGCTRAQIVTFLWRTEGCPKPKTAKNPFVDVKTGDWYYDAVLWAVENGITEGFPDGTFQPNGLCTRAQSVTFLYRLFGYEPEDFEWGDLETNFPDVKKDWYYDALMWASYRNLVGGFPDGTFGPKEICTRAQIVTFLYRILG